jgi:pimeloyl-ACP methyl ester carboxylesterase
MKRIVPVFLVLMIAAGQSAAMPSFMERAYGAQKKACEAGFNKEYVKAGIFTLTTYERLKGPSETIRIYIEGDGRAWESKGRLSDDPTPSNPIALGLATADSSDAVVYIARPGQFPDTFPSGCDPTYWSQRRFAPEVVEALDKVIDKVKERSGARSVEIVGYSGGGALAVLVAARRSDVSSIRTVAGNLEPKALCEYHNVSQLEGSMDPLDFAQKVAHIPQFHFVGGNDKAIPAFIARSFIAKSGGLGDNRIIVINDASHTNGWQQRWQELLAIPVD